MASSVVAARQRQLMAELTVAIRHPGVDLAAWGRRAAGTLGIVLIRRAKNLGRLLGRTVTAVGTEVSAFWFAARSGNLPEHIGSRTGSAVDSSIEFAQSVQRTTSAVSRSLVESPQDSAPRVIGVVLGFFAGSGGLDGDGGVPDLDLLAGIGAHRSIFTHSVLAGAVLETAILASIDLADTVFGGLPADHDPLWDALRKSKTEAALAFSRGASVGIGYHLMVDALIQPAAYKDLPFPAQIEAHQALMAANAAAESIDGFATRVPSVGDRVGENVTKATSRAASAIKGAARATVSGVRKLKKQ